jgi:hypothetical protein
MNSDDREDIAHLVNFSFPNQKIASRQVNPQVALFIFDILQRAKECSSNMNYVPRPTYHSEGFRLMVKELKRIAKRIVQNQGKTYLNCRDTLSLYHLTGLKEALIGL